MNERATLELPPDQGFLPVATAFAEHSARTWGLGQEEALALTLAAEEIFVFLCDLGLGVRLRSANGVYYAEVEFSFHASPRALAAMESQGLNLTSTLNPEDEDDLSRMGLMLATRTVDRFRIEQAPGHHMVITVRKYRRYPEVTGCEPGPAGPAASVAYREPTPEELSLLCRRVTRDYPPMYYHEVFRTPGMVVDMVGSGAFQALVAVDPQGDVVGGLLLNREREGIAFGHGPFLVSQPPAVAQGLLEAALQRLARTSTPGLVFARPTPDLPHEQMEELGTRQFHTRDGRTVEIKSWYRHLAEEEGRVSWCDEDLRPYLEAEYERLVLPRDLRLAPSVGSARLPHSLLGVEFDRTRSRAILRPFTAGDDIEANLRRHVEVLTQEGWRNLLFFLDLGCSWQVPFAPALRAVGFEPKVLVPNGAKGDAVLFQLREAGP